MRLRLIFTICLISLLMPLTSYSAWQTPVEIIGGKWGSGDREFGIEKGDTSDRLPDLTAILFDGKIAISDQVNERELAYKPDGSLLKVIPWEITQNNQKVTNPEFLLYHYWNVQGYSKEEGIWIKFDEYVLVKSATGQTVKTSKERPPELGIVNEEALGNGKYRVTVTYPDRAWSYIGAGVVPKYMRDIKGNLYGSGHKQSIRWDSCGNEIDRLTMPEGCGSPIVAPNGDVYTDKHTAYKYSIIKWTWVEEENKTTKKCTEANSAQK